MNKRKKMDSSSTAKMVCAGMFIAIIVVMTVVPYTGYIEIVPAAISITTLHIPVIIAGIILGWKYGAVIGGVWGISCLIRAFTMPTVANIPFQNPIVTVLPRIAVGIVAGLIFSLFRKKCKFNITVSSLIAAICGSLTNTFLVLSALYAFGSLGEGTIALLFDTIIATLVGVNGIIELAAAAIITPLVRASLRRISFIED